MAIYHFSAQVISRGKGQSAIASASYRSGEKLVDEKTGEVKFYKREVQPESMILAPSHAPEWTTDRQRLWSEVEAIEKNWNSQLAREINIALPRELTNEQQKELIRDFAQKEFVDRGMVADIAIHRDDQENPHAHIMLTIRKFEEDGQWGSKKKREYIFDEKGEVARDQRGQKKFITVPQTDWDKKETLERWREEWANHANQALEKYGFKDRISHLSHEERGLEQLPTIHLGHVAHAMEEKGIQSERGNINREIQRANETLVGINKEIESLKAKVIKLEATEAKIQRFYTPEDRETLNKAEKILKGKKLSLVSISNRLEQLEGFQEQVAKAERAIYSKGLGSNDDKDKSDLDKLRRQRKLISYEKDILTKAESIIKDGRVRQVAFEYPNNPEVNFMDYEQAMKLNQLNQKMGRVVPIDELKEQVRKFEKAKEILPPESKNEEKLNNTLSILSGLVNAVEQANKDMEKSSNTKQKKKHKQKHKQKQKELGMELS
jgi:hypothetical protein